MRTPRTRNTAADALSILSAVALASFVGAMLYFARDILIPVALAGLLTFLVAPLVTRLERFVGRIVAVLLVVTMMFAGTGMAGWVLTQQLIDLATKLPDYKENILTKVQAFRLPPDTRFRAFFKTVEEVRKELPGAAPSPPVLPRDGSKTATAVVVPPPAPTPTSPMDLLRSIIGPLIGPLGTAALVLVLVICMLFQREDLRRRFIRLIGHGHIGTTTRALDDATHRVSRYLLMQLVINVTIGITVAAGLYFIGVPNALLWGGFSTVFRFIPYVGPWIAAGIPTILSLAVSPDWTMPTYTIGLFVLVELVSSYAMEPWLYGSSTGVSPIALILAAVVWTWLWGPLGLVMATPLTVCLVVLGRHVPQFSFLSVLLSDEEALTPAEDFYQRMLTLGEHDEMDLVETYLQAHSLAALYDDVFVPVVSGAETDARLELIDQNQLAGLEQSMRDIMQDLSSRGVSVVPGNGESNTAAPETSLPPAVPGTRVLCLAARAERDELVGSMLAHLLQQNGWEAWSLPASRPVTAELFELVEKSDVDAVVISVVAPSTVLHARYLCMKLRAHFAQVPIVVGLWGAGNGDGNAGKRLREAGANVVAVSLAQAVEEIARFAVDPSHDMTPAPMPPGEDDRLAALRELEVLDTGSDPFLDRITRRLARVFEMPIALVSLVDGERIVFKSQVGLPPDLAQSRHASRDVSVCGHVVATDDVMVVEDLARDRRFANNQWLRERGWRFYAGAPLHAPGAQPIGTLCLLDTKPRQFSDRDRRQLREYANEISEELARRALPSAMPAALAK